MADNNLSTGKSQLNGQLLAGAANLAGPAAQLAQGASAMQVASGELKSAFMDKLLGPTAAFTGLLTGSLMVLKKVLGETQLLEKGMAQIGAMQQFRGKFETLLKSATAAHDRLKELSAFTRSSPFQFKSVAEANLQLLRLTKGAFAGKEAMALVGDAAASAGVDMAEMANRVGRVHNAIMSGRGLDKVVFQLQQTGLATDDLINRLEQLESTGQGQEKMWSAVKDVLLQTQGGMAQEMKTIEALTSTYANAQSVMAEGFAMPFLAAQESAIVSMTKATENLSPVVATIGSDLAVVGGVFAKLKSSVVDSTLALPGMATALGVVWEAVKNSWIVLAAITAASATAGFSGMVKFAGSAIDAATSIDVAAKAADGMRTAMERLREAGKAAEDLDLKQAATKTLLAAKSAVVAKASLVHAGGMKAIEEATKAATAAAGTATAVTGLAAAQNYVLGSSAVVAAGAVNLLGKAFDLVADIINGAFKALFANPFLLIITGLTVATIGLVKWINSMKEAVERAKELANAINAIVDESNKMKEGIKTIDDWVNTLAKLRSEYSALYDAVAQYNREVANGAEKTDAQKQEQEIKKYALERKRDDLKNTTNMDQSKLGLGSNEVEAIRKDQEGRRAAEESDYQRRYDTETDPDKKLAMEKERVEKLQAEAATAMASHNAATKPARSAERKSLEELKNAKNSGDAVFEAEKKTIRERPMEKQPLPDLPSPNMSGYDVDIDLRLAKARARREYEGNFEIQKAAELAALEAKHAADLKANAEATAEIKRKSINEVTRAQQALDDGITNGGDQEQLQRNLADAQARQANAQEIDQAAKDAAARYAQNVKNKERSDAKANSDSGFDTQIAGANAKGDTDEAARLTFLKEQARIELELKAAQEDQDKVLQCQLESQKKLVEAAEERRKVEVARAKEAGAATAEADDKIRAARHRGEKTATAEAKKRIEELKRAEEQAIADKGADSPEAVAATNARKNAEADEKDRKANAQKDAATERAANSAAAGGDKKGAKAIRDAAELDKMKKDYEDNGMTGAQAEADFKNSLMASAAGQTPKIVADSKQAIGGGGGVSRGSDPMVAAQERAKRAIETSNGLLKGILDALNPVDD